MCGVWRYRIDNWVCVGYGGIAWMIECAGGMPPEPYGDI